MWAVSSLCTTYNHAGLTLGVVVWYSGRTPRETGLSEEREVWFRREFMVGGAMRDIGETFPGAITPAVVSVGGGFDQTEPRSPSACLAGVLRHVLNDTRLNRGLRDFGEEVFTLGWEGAVRTSEGAGRG